MSVAVVTGSAGLIGSEAVRFLCDKFDVVVGIDNDMRRYFFGNEASTLWNCNELKATVASYVHRSADIREQKDVNAIFAEYGSDIELIIHTAAQPSHDWAAREPLTDFTVNANGTMILLEATRQFCPEASFVFTSTNKVYGDNPNRLPLFEDETRWEVDPSHGYFEKGIDESMSIDYCKHSLFGASKAAADLVVQEYGRYFDMNTVVFRGGCLTGGGHSGTELHGFLSYLMRCCVEGRPYTVFGYKGKQVRDNIHSSDLVNMFWQYHQAPRPGEVYNAGGSRHSHCSMREAITLCEEISGRKLDYTVVDDNRIGDHIWYVSDVSKFREDYPDWSYQYDLEAILGEIYEGWQKRLQKAAG
ncbi:CDP-paratose 2-epimerase [Planctomycetes bacterium Pan216]|uniref:CDP-paratose 2-epimerase n=1 Tax=Kolteria novifilia TaxID=2527975 RepID=A0A518BAA7_9BACT|nr:CDP-paratose 2-epimerase [Planctomycetes bacterium Pan216]